LKLTVAPYIYNDKSKENGAGQLQFLTPTKAYHKPRTRDTVELVFFSRSSSPSIISAPPKKKNDFKFN
jgi:hypothetical protein